MPVGKPNGDGYYMYRGFRPNGHLGEDWNGLGGGNSDLGDPVYSVAHGMVVFAKNAGGGWGNVVIVRHVYLENGRPEMVDSLYAHLERVTVREGQQVLRGDQVGTIGTNNGMYAAHLHFEMRKNIYVGMNRAKFPRDYSVYHKPSEFINARRKLPGEGRVGLIAINTFDHSNRNYAMPRDESRGRLVSNRGYNSRSNSSRTSEKASDTPTSRPWRVTRFNEVGL